LLTLRSKKAFERIFSLKWDEVIETTCEGASFWRKGKKLAENNGLFQAVLYAAGELRQLSIATCEEPRRDFALRPQCQIKSQGRNIPLRCPMALPSAMNTDRGDGIKSVVARTLFGDSFNQKTVGFGLEVDVAFDEVPNFPQNPEIHFGAARWGYGWVFPKKGCATIGIGGLYCKNPDLMSGFQDFLLQRCGHKPSGRIKGHFLPFGDYRAQPGENNILLVGDAAGLVDSITGEGIAFAMQSGEAAGFRRRPRYAKR